MSLDYNPEEENWKEFDWAALEVKDSKSDIKQPMSYRRDY